MSDLILPDRFHKSALDLFPALLSNEQMEQIHRLRVKKAKKKGLKVTSKLIDIQEDEYILKGGGLDDQGNIIDDFDIRRYMDDMEDPETGTLLDLKIDLRDLPLAKNFYDFCFNLAGKKIHPPWARQVWMGVMLFGEVCPCCSDKKWLDIQNVPKDYPAKDILAHLVLLEKGKCPKCKRNKHELIVNHGLKDFMQFVACLGQRCVTKDTLILTGNGIEYIGNMAEGMTEGFNPYKKLVHNGSVMEKTSDFYVAPRKESIHRVILKDGGVIKGTSDHPLLTSKGFKRIENLTTDDYIAVSTNTQVWGTTIPSFKDAYSYAQRYVKKAIRLRRGGYFRLTRIKKKSGLATVDWFTLLGLWTAEGRGTIITNWDIEVNSFLSVELNRTFNNHDWCNVEEKSVRIFGIKGYKFLEYFIGRDLNSGSAKKHIPTCVLQAPKEYVCAFLRGLFEGDGGFEGKKLTYTTISRQLAFELRTVLLNLGIAPRLTQGWTWASNGTPKQISKKCYTLTIVGPLDLQLYKDQIGFITQRKQQSLNNALNFYHNERKVNAIFLRDKLPIHLNHEIRSFIKECVTAVSELPIPVEFDGHGFYCTKNQRLVKTKKAIGRLTLLYRKPYYWLNREYQERKDLAYYPGSYEGMKRIGKDVNLAKPFLKILLDQISYFDEYLPPALLHKKQYFYSYLDETKIWVKVAKIERDAYVAQTYDLTLPKSHRFVGNGIVNHNSGKSFICALLNIYLLHLYIKFPNYPSLTNSMQYSTQLTSTFVSLSATKAIGVLWTPFRRMLVEDCLWYTELFNVLKHYKTVYGKDLYRESTLYANFYFKNIKLYPSGPRSTTLRGDTRIAASLDELGLFPLPKGNEEEDENSERANADEAHKSLFNSLGTINVAYQYLLKKGYYTAPPALLFNVSSPISQRDKMMRLLREAKTPEGSKLILGINLPTWEVNPSYERDSPIIVAAYLSNPEKAERDFGANPPAVHSRLIPINSFSENVFINGQNSHNLVYQFDSPGELYGKIEINKNYNKYPSILAMDAGHVNNSFALAGGHYDFDTGKTVITTLLECMPHEGLTINFNLLYINVILPLLKQLNAVGLVADQWQGLDILYRSKDDMGDNPRGKIRCKPKQYSLKRKDFNTFLSMLQSKSLILPTIDDKDKQFILDGRISNYRQELIGKPVSHLFYQMFTVRDVGETRCPEKGENATDDIFRTLVVLTSVIHNPAVMDRLREARNDVYDSLGLGKKPNPAPIFVGRSGMGFRGLR